MGQGFAPNRMALLLRAQVMVVQAGLGVELSDTWLKGFQRRHPELPLRAPAPVEAKFRIPVATELLQNYYNVQLEVARQAEEDERIIIPVSMDETFVSKLLRSLKVFAHVDVPNAHRVLAQAKTTQEHMTFCGAVAAHEVLNAMLPLLWLFSPKCDPQHEFAPHVDNSADRKRSYRAATESGWMTQKMFVYWVELFIAAVNRFLDMDDNRTKYRIVLYLDLATSHLTLEASDMLAKAGIVVIMVAPRDTSHHQVMDVGIYLKFKTVLDRMLKERMRQLGVYDLPWADVVKLAAHAWEQSSTFSTVMAAFEKACVHPLREPDELIERRENRVSVLRNDYYAVVDAARRVVEGELDPLTAPSDTRDMSQLAMLLLDVNRKAMAPALRDLSAQVHVGRMKPTPLHDAGAPNAFRGAASVRWLRSGEEGEGEPFEKAALREGPAEQATGDRQGDPRRVAQEEPGGGGGGDGGR